MDLTALTVGGPAPQAAPRYIPDLRPAADAAALARDPRPVAAASSTLLGAPQPVLPPMHSQIGAISRSMVEGVTGVEDPANATMPPAKAPERVLKPWGITMLPATQPEPRTERPEPEPGVEAEKAPPEATADAPAEAAEADHSTRPDGAPEPRGDAAPEPRAERPAVPDRERQERRDRPDGERDAA